MGAQGHVAAIRISRNERQAEIGQEQGEQTRDQDRTAGVRTCSPAMPEHNVKITVISHFGLANTVMCPVSIVYCLMYCRQVVADYGCSIMLRAARVFLITKTCLNLKVVNLRLVYLFVRLFGFGLLSILYLKEASVCVCVWCGVCVCVCMCGVCVCVCVYVCVYISCVNSKLHAAESIRRSQQLLS